MSFGLGRAEMKITPTSTNQGGNVLKRYIPQGPRLVPGYTGHVPGIRRGGAGLAKSFGATTGSLLAGGSSSETQVLTLSTKPRKLALDTPPRAPYTVGKYTQPGVHPGDMYRTGNHTDLYKKGHSANVQKAIGGYAGHVPNIRGRMGGPGQQYYREDSPGKINQPMSSWRKGRARTEGRDATRAYDKPWALNKLPLSPQGIGSGFDRKPAAFNPNLQQSSSISAGMGPKTARSPWKTS
eukprot:m.84344 g.84344  ORF g.84344 m.84344 type:complete len:238 (+) comp25738_c1_seq1:259-972(+)